MREWTWSPQPELEDRLARTVENVAEILEPVTRWRTALHVIQDVTNKKVEVPDESAFVNAITVAALDPQKVRRIN